MGRIDVKIKCSHFILFFLLLISEMVTVHSDMTSTTAAPVDTTTTATTGTKTTTTVETTAENIRNKRQLFNGGYDDNQQFLGFGRGYGGFNGGFEDYCHDCNHCNGCGHRPNRRVLIEYDYVPK